MEDMERQDNNEKTDQSIVEQSIVQPQSMSGSYIGLKKEIPQGIKNVGEQFEFFGLLSLLFGVIYSFCLFRNPGGITYPLLILGGYGIAVRMLGRMKLQVKKLSYFIILVSFLLSVTSALTANGLILYLNRVVLFFLACVFMLHQFYGDEKWNIGKYVSSVLVFLCYGISCLGYPFQHMSAYLKGVKNKKFKNILMVLTGLAIGIPVMIVLTMLLSAADMVFREILGRMLDTFLNPWTIFLSVCKAVVGALAIYCFLCSACMKNLKEELADRRSKEPLVAITGMGIIALVYLLFCGVQIIYLFLGSGNLPEGITYSEYARQGFFQLLFVVFLNLIMVLCCIKYFKKSGGLNVVLTVICGCTYVMIASAVYRMLLYVGTYHLTFLRVLVLWFLALLAVLMGGVVALIFKNTFPLFRFCLVTISVFYLGFAGIKPDRVIAEYNVSHMEVMNLKDCEYLFDRLSADAAGVVERVGKERFGEMEGYMKSRNLHTKEQFNGDYYHRKIRFYDWNRSLRTLNLSYENARKLFP